MKDGKDLLALKRKKQMSQGMWTIFRIWEWTLAASQDVHGNLSNTATAAGFFQPSTKVRTQLYAGRLQRSHIFNHVLLWNCNENMFPLLSSVENC